MKKSKLQHFMVGARHKPSHGFGLLVALPLLLAFLFLSALIVSSAEIKKLPKPEKSAVKPDGKYTATVETSMGGFEIELFPAQAPYTVTNFIYLAKAKFYDGLIFHRVVPGHVIQGGDPLGNGFGDAGYTIPAEINERKHLEGAVGMARSGDDMNSAGSQFYICLAPKPQLDGQYTVFGQVVKGMDIVHKIEKVPTSGSGGNPPDMPLDPVIIKSITIKESK